MKRKVLFGGDDLKWSSDDWTASDDRVRGGKSQSYLTPLPASHYSTARFYGHLDIKTLGGAGFASQRTTASDTAATWDLSSFDGIDLVLEDGDDKLYTFILKDEIAEELLYVDEGETGRETKREQATVSWEFDFRVPESIESVGEGVADDDDKNENNTNEKKKKKKGKGKERKIVSIPWKSLKPTYRGKAKKDAKPIDLKSIRRMSLMMRSFFGTQEGDFELTLRSIEAVTRARAKDVEGVGERGVIGDVGSNSDSDSDECGGPAALKASSSIGQDGEGRESREQRRRGEGWLGWLLERCWKVR